MPLGAMLDVAIGLIFTYLLVALFAAAVQEWFASLLKKRSEQLYDGLWRLLTTDNHNRDRVSPRSITTPAAGAPVMPASATGFFDAVWGHELIKGLSQDSHGPSYIPSRAFCTALVDVLRNGSSANSVSAIEQSINGLPPGAAKQALSAIFVEAAGDLDRFKASVAAWFDDAMERASGAYKRWAQKYTFLFGLAAAVILNVSTIDVAKTLWRDPEARKAVAVSAEAWANEEQAKQQAEQDATSSTGDQPKTDEAPAAGDKAKTDEAAPAAGQAKTPSAGAQADPAEPAAAPRDAAADTAASDQSEAAPAKTADEQAAAADKRAKELAAKLDELPLPIGWNDNWAKVLFGVEHEACVMDKPCKPIPLDPTTLGHLLQRLFGWLLTGLAAALGAPFWFDTLQKFINIRSAGKPPVKGETR